MWASCTKPRQVGASYSFLSQRVRQLCGDLTQHLAVTPLLESAMHPFVVGIALRQQMPLRAGLQNPAHRLQHCLCGPRLTPWPGIRDVLFRDVLSNLVPLVIAQPEQDQTYRDGEFMPSTILR
jgi:hypothetical protein